MATLVTVPRDLCVFMEEKRRQPLKVSASPRQVGSLAPARASLIAQLVKKKIRLQCRRPQFDPWVGKIPWRRERLLTPVFWPGEFHWLYSPWGRRVRHYGATFTFTALGSCQCSDWVPLSLFSDSRWGSDERERERERTRLCVFLSVVDTALERSEGGSLGAKGSCDIRHPSLNPAGITCSFCDLT